LKSVILEIRLWNPGELSNDPDHVTQWASESWRTDYWRP